MRWYLCYWSDVVPQTSRIVGLVVGEKWTGVGEGAEGGETGEEVVFGGGKVR